MHITITWYTQGQYPSFNLGLHSNAESEEFLSIKGCKIFDGAKGSFDSYPATKKVDGNYWRHAWGSEKFNAVVLAKALESRPAQQQQQNGNTGGSVPNLESDIPF